RLRDVAPAQRHVQELLPRVPEALLDFTASPSWSVLLLLHELRCAEVVSGREVLTLPVEDYHANLRVVDGGGEGLVQLAQQFPRLRVSRPGTVHRHARDAVERLVADGGRRRRRSVATRMPRVETQTVTQYVNTLSR